MKIIFLKSFAQVPITNFNFYVIYNQSRKILIIASLSDPFKILLFRIRLIYKDIKILRFVYLIMFVYICLILKIKSYDNI